MLNAMINPSSYLSIRKNGSITLVQIFPCVLWQQYSPFLGHANQIWLICWSNLHNVCRQACTSYSQMWAAFPNGLKKDICEHTPMQDCMHV